MKFRKINLEICRKCRSDAGAEDESLLSSLAFPAFIFDDWMDDSTGKFQTVYWTRHHSMCARIDFKEISSLDEFNNSKRSLESGCDGDETQPSWSDQIRRSVRILKGMMEKSSCECEINERNCPYLMEQAILGAGDETSSPDEKQPR